MTHTFWWAGSTTGPVTVPRSDISTNLGCAAAPCLPSALSQHRQRLALPAVEQADLTKIAAFKADQLRTLFAQEGRTDDFRELECELYIAATDLDTCERIVFGADGWDDVSISSAVRAFPSLMLMAKSSGLKYQWLARTRSRRTLRLHSPAFRTRLALSDSR